MELCIDAGNTRTKLAVFESGKIRFQLNLKRLTTSALRPVFKRFDIKSCILSSVTSVPASSLSFIRQHCILVRLNPRTILPLTNRYKTPETLGSDRLATAVGISKIFPGKNILAIDLGTCIKYDFVNSRNEYLGGSISPGLNMRFQSLHAFTGKLPLIKAETMKRLTGRSTKESILSGVQLGMLNEMKGFIQQYKKEYKSLKVVLSGGDAARFAGQLKIPIFAASDLVLIGLHEILLKNVPE